MSNIKNTSDSNTWMIVYTTPNHAEAHIIAGRLQHEGIQAIVDHAIGSQAIGITVNLMGEVRVLVHPSDYDAAMDILEAEDDVPALDDSNADVVYYLDDDEDDDDE